MIGFIKNNCSKNNLIVISQGCSQKEVARYLGGFLGAKPFPIVCKTPEDAVEIATDLDLTMRRWAQVLKEELTWDEVKKEKKEIYEQRKIEKEEESRRLEETFIW